METGDPCFAHVRSYPWWPAKIVKKSLSSSNLKKELFQVKFYGTGETASLPLKELAAISPDTIGKFSSPAAMKRKYFKEGLDQMEAEFGQISSIRHQSGISLTTDQTLPNFQLTPVPVRKVKVTPVKKVKVAPSKKVKKTPVNREVKNTSNKTVTDSARRPLEEITNVEPGNDVIDTNDAPNDSFDWGEFEPPTHYRKPKPLKKRDFFASGRKASYHCEDCGESFAMEPTKDLHKITAHGEATEDDADNTETSERRNILEEVSSSTVPVKPKMPRRCSSSLPKLVKTLREDEAEGNKLFNEKIEVRENFFFCKGCPKFSTASKMKAKCHAISCGKKKKKSRFRKLSPCLLCEQVFESKKFLKLHHKANHFCPSYTCSTCQKNFTLRQNYKRHLVLHKEAAKLSCPNILCSKVFQRKFNLARHMKVHTQLRGKSGMECAVPQKQVNTEFPAVEKPQFSFSEQPIPKFDLQLSSVDEVSFGSGFVLLNCNFVGEELSSVYETSSERLENNFEKDEEGIEHWVSLFISDVVSDLVKNATSFKQVNLETSGHSPSSCPLPSYNAAQDKYNTTGVIENAVPSSSQDYDGNGSQTSQLAFQQESLANLQSNSCVSCSDHLPVTPASQFPASEYPPQYPSSSHISHKFSPDNDQPVSQFLVNPSHNSTALQADPSLPSSSQDQPQFVTTTPPSPQVLLEGMSSGGNQEVLSAKPGRSSSKGQTCPHCGVEGILGPSKLQVHIDRMHSAPVLCKICDVSFVDKYCFVLHYPNCFYFCPRPGCNFHDKRKQRFTGHMRTHE